MLTKKIKQHLLGQFIEQNYNDLDFIGHFIEARLALIGEVVKRHKPEIAVDIIESLLMGVDCKPPIIVARNISEFRAGVRAAIRGFWNGELDKFEFVDSMNSTLTRNLTRAWNDGAKECGIQPEELTQKEIEARASFVNKQINFLPGFADHIEENTRELKGKLSPLFDRAELWINRWREAKTRGAAMACADEKRKWFLGATEKHCRSCGGFNQRVYRFSVWLRNEALPQNRNLSCGGFKCLCDLKKTNDRITAGRFPAGLLG